jgi:hypothetical protein
MRLTHALTTVLLLAATPCKAGCHVDHFSYYYGFDVPAAMRVTSGETCSMNFVLGRKSNMESLAISERSKHGTASWNGNIGYPAVLYRSSPGYKGPDAIVLKITGASTRRQGVATVHVAVDVK